MKDNHSAGEGKANAPLSEYPKEIVIPGKIENGRCYVNVAFGRYSAEGELFVKLPWERTAIDTYWPGITLPFSLAQSIGLDIDVINAAPPGKRTQWSKNVKGIARVYYELKHPLGQTLWSGEAEAIVVNAEEPSIGMAQLMNWKFSIDGPSKSFELRVPQPERSEPPRVY